MKYLKTFESKRSNLKLKNPEYVKDVKVGDILYCINPTDMKYKHNTYVGYARLEIQVGDKCEVLSILPIDRTRHIYFDLKNLETDRNIYGWSSLLFTTPEGYEINNNQNKFNL